LLGGVRQTPGHSRASSFDGRVAELVLALRSIANYAHKSIYGGERNLTVAALGLSDGSIAVETKAEARSTQASSSVGVDHA
jgi:hypothetical protein